MIMRSLTLLLAMFGLLLLPPLQAWAQPAEASSADARTTQYVFVIDDSASMSKRTSGGPAADPDRLSVFAVRSLLSMLDDQDEAAIVRLNAPFQGEAIASPEPIKGRREALSKALDLTGPLASYAGKQTPCQSTLDALQATLNRSFRPQTSQVVFFLTDGECTGEAPNPAAYIKGLESAKADLFKFYLLRFEGRTYTKSLAKLAELTGGEETLVSAQDPTSILKPFASALSRSQGYDAYLLTPKATRLSAHKGARRLRLLAVAPDLGQDLKFELIPTQKGTPPRILSAPKLGVHQYADGRRFRYASLDYAPGDTPMNISVTGAEDQWKIVAVPEYKISIDITVQQGLCDKDAAQGQDVQFIEVGADVCVTVTLKNAQGEPITEDLAGRGTEAFLFYNAPGAMAPTKLPGNRLGERAIFTLERANLERGDHLFRPSLSLRTPGAQDASLTLQGAARTLQVSSRHIAATPARIDLGEVLPGQERYNEVTLSGNFPPSTGRVVLEGRDGVPECVHVELSGVPEGKAQRFIPDQSYSLSIKTDGYCGRTSFSRKVDSAVRLEFDRTASSRPLPSVTIPLQFTLVNKVEFPDAIDIQVDGASSKIVALHVTSNSERTVEFRAVIPPVKERRGWPGENLRLALVGGDDKPVRKEDGSLALDQNLRLGPQMRGEFARFQVTADACCEGGTYRTKVAFVPKMGAKEVIQIPVTITVKQAGAWRCWGGTILWSILGFVLILLLLFLLNMFRQSQFIRRDILASRLIPLRWDEWGEPAAVSRQAEDVKRMVRRAMPWWARALNWMKANPLKIGWFGGSYEETVQLFLEPARDISRSRVTLVPERDLYATLRNEPENARGRIYACAKGGLFVYAVPDREGRLGRLQYDDALSGGGGSGGWGDEEEVQFELIRLRRDDLLALGDDREPDMAAGWRVG